MSYIYMVEKRVQHAHTLYMTLKILKQLGETEMPTRGSKGVRIRGVKALQIFIDFYSHDVPILMMFL